MRKALAGFALSLMLAAAPVVAVAAEDEGSSEEADHPEARLYDASINATDAINAAMARAAEREVNVLIVLGANWCHDSRAFAGWTETDRIGGLIAERFELVFVNVGMPQTGDGHNQHILKRFRFDAMEGTPMVLIATPDGYVRNRDTAASWRDTASRSEDDTFHELNQYPLPTLSKPLKF